MRYRYSFPGRYIYTYIEIMDSLVSCLMHAEERNGRTGGDPPGSLGEARGKMGCDMIDKARISTPYGVRTEDIVKCIIYMTSC